jgi:hypothetical protein
VSNRVRILLLVPNAKGNQLEAHMGTNALKYLEHWYQNSTSTSFNYVIVTDPSTGKSFPQYHDAKKTLPQPPKNLPNWRRARWLWEHIPGATLNGAQLTITRERRSLNWRISPANPTTYGVYKKNPPKTASTISAALLQAATAGQHQQEAKRPSYAKSSRLSYKQMYEDPPEFEPPFVVPSGKSKPKKSRNGIAVAGEVPTKPALRVGIWS